MGSPECIDRWLWGAASPEASERHSLVIEIPEPSIAEAAAPLVEAAEPIVATPAAPLVEIPESGMQEVARPAIEIPEPAVPEPPAIDWRNLIAMAAGQDDASKLLEYAEALLECEPNSGLALQALVQAKLGAGDYKGAIQHGMRLVKRMPQSYQAWFNLGLSFQKTNNPEKAAQAYSEAIKLEPRAVPARSNIGVVLLEHGDVSGARQEFERALEIEPENAIALWNMALVQEKEGQAGQAEQLYTRLIESGSHTAGASFRLGLLRIARKEYAGAAEAFERCRAEPGMETASAINLGLVHWKAGDCAEATSVLDAVLQRDPDSVRALEFRAVLALESGDWKRAEELEHRLAGLGENTSVLAYNIGVLQQAEDLPEEASASFARACDGQPEMIAALINGGHALKASGKHAQSARAWKAALAVRPELAADYFKTGAASPAG